MGAHGRSAGPAEEEETKDTYKVTLTPALLETSSLTSLILALKLRQEDCHKYKLA